MKEREKAAIQYAEQLKKKYKHFPEVKRILRHRHLPGHIYSAKNEHRIMKESQKKKLVFFCVLYKFILLT